MNILSILVNFCCFLSTIPFVSPFLVNTDVQLPVFIVALFILILDVARNKFRLNRFDLFFLFLGIMSIGYFDLSGNYIFEVSKRVGLLLSFLVYYVFSRYWKLINPGSFLAGVYLNLLGALVQYFYPLFWVNLISSHFVMELRVPDITGLRGVSAFAPEPGFLGAMSVYFMVGAYLFLHEKRIGISTFILVMFSCTLMAVMSCSGTGIALSLLFFSLLIILEKISLYAKLIIVSGLVLGLFMFVEFADFGGRGREIASIIVSNPGALLTSDLSVIFRLLPLLAGIESIFDGHLLGQGWGGKSHVSMESLFGFFSNDSCAIVLERMEGLDSSAFGRYTFELGFLFIAFLVWLYSRGYRKRQSILTRIISISFLMASFSIVFPPLWIMLAATDKRNEQN